MVEEAFSRFNNHLKCERCGEQHNCQRIFRMLSDLRMKMEEAEVGEINEALVEDFQEKFEQVWRVYLGEVEGTTCGKKEED